MTREKRAYSGWRASENGSERGINRRELARRGGTIVPLHDRTRTGRNAALARPQVEISQADQATRHRRLLHTACHARYAGKVERLGSGQRRGRSIDDPLACKQRGIRCSKVVMRGPRHRPVGRCRDRAARKSLCLHGEQTVRVEAVAQRGPCNP